MQLPEPGDNECPGAAGLSSHLTQVLPPTHPLSRGAWPRYVTLPEHIPPASAGGISSEGGFGVCPAVRHMLTLSPTPQGPWGRGGNGKRATIKALTHTSGGPSTTPYVSKWPHDQKEFGDGGGGPFPPGTSTATLAEAPQPGGAPQLSELCSMS